MSGPVKYRRQAYRSSSADLDRICIRPGRIEYGMSEERAHMLLQELDSALHPWGEHGVVPTEPGEYWVIVVPYGGDVWPARFDGHEWFSQIGEEEPWNPTDYNKSRPRFRRRWTPEVPRG